MKNTYSDPIEIYFGMAEMPLASAVEEHRILANGIQSMEIPLTSPVEEHRILANGIQSMEIPLTCGAITVK